jgi:hypothetical protein
MWQNWYQATKYSKLPSEVFDPSGASWMQGGKFGPVAQWMFNTCITWFGTTIENALAERVKVGVGANEKSVPRYTLARLLHPQFKLIAPQRQVQDDPNPWAELMSWAGKRGSGINKYRYQKPVD